VVLEGLTVYSGVLRWSCEMVHGKSQWFRGAVVLRFAVVFKWFSWVLVLVEVDLVTVLVVAFMFHIYISQ